jgi:hypothetical protein
MSWQQAAPWDKPTRHQPTRSRVCSDNHWALEDELRVLNGAKPLMLGDTPDHLPAHELTTPASPWPYATHLQDIFEFGPRRCRALC